MEVEEIELFHNEVERTLSPFLNQNGFQLKTKEINTSIGAYKLIFEKLNSKYISIDFCIHHYDLFDGVTIKLQGSNNDSVTYLNSLPDQFKRKIYNQLNPKESVHEIINDLKLYCADFVYSN